jgi:hypothetical protein
MQGWRMTPQDMENHANDAARVLLKYLYTNQYLDEETEDELMEHRPIILYRQLPWYTRLWKTLWPGQKADEYTMVVARMDDIGDWKALKEERHGPKNS